MGETNMSLIEKSIEHNTEDIRELKKKVSHHDKEIGDLKINQRVTSNTLNSLTESINDLKTSFKELDRKMDKDKEEQLKAYKSAVWKVGIAIITAFFLIQLGLK